MKPVDAVIDELNYLVDNKIIKSGEYQLPDALRRLTEKGKKFKESNFKKLLLDIHSTPAETQKNRIHDNFENWKGQLEQIDDICVIGVRV